MKRSYLLKALTMVVPLLPGALVASAPERAPLATLIEGSKEVQETVAATSPTNGGNGKGTNSQSGSQSSNSGMSQQGGSQKGEADPALKDKVSRAYGLLAHSYQIHTQEALSALSLIHLGKELHWIEGAEELPFHHLFFSCRRAHLLHETPENNSQPVNSEELLKKHAALLHDHLKAARLTI